MMIRLRKLNKDMQHYQRNRRAGKNARLLASFVGAFTLMGGAIHQAIANSTFKDRAGRSIQIEVIQVLPKDFSEDRQVFVEGFWNNYKKIRPSDLKPHFKTGEDVKKWLDDVFTDEMDSLKKSFLQESSLRTERYLQAKLDGKVVGVLFLDVVRAKQPDEAYIRQMAVSPEFQKNGIGSHLVQAVYEDKDLYPSLKVIHVVVRRTNVDSIAFYKSVGFADAPYVHPDYDPHYYAGFDRVLKPK